MTVKPMTSDKKTLQEFLVWWKSEPHRLKYSDDHSAFLAGMEAWWAAREWALNEAALICERRYMGDNTREDMEARRCAEEIRAYKDKK